MDLACGIGILSVNAVLLVASLLKELGSDLVEHCVGENVLVLLDPLCAFLAESIKLRLKQICGTAIDSLLALEYGRRRQQHARWPWSPRGTGS